MMYYINEGSRYAPKNKLQKSVLEAVAEFDGLLLHDADVFYDHLKNVVADCNSRYPKQVPIVVDTSGQGDARPFFTLRNPSIMDSRLATFSLEPVRGEFKLPTSDESVVNYTPDELAQMAFDYVTAHSIMSVSDGDLVLIRKLFMTNETSCRAGNLPDEPDPVVQTYPAAFWEMCVEQVEDEIKLRTQLVRVQEGDVQR